ncbi:MAG TPA: hypothetical protein VJT15_07435 [Pyrinomonadaceae bacterium]|nr:hypothetical protein [Pyrinomonadaceae bacterium]
MRITHITFVVALLLICGGWSIANGQPTGAEGGKVRQPEQKGQGRVRPAVKTEIRFVTPTTGSLAVYAKSGANLLVEPLKLAKPTRGRPEALTIIVPGDKNVVIFNDLKPGLYRVAGTLDKHHGKETTIIITANDYFAASLDFSPILYSVTIQSNVATGDVRYGPEGEQLNLVAPLVNGKAQINVPEGKYTFAVSTTEFGYEGKRQTFVVDKNQLFPIDLNRIVLSTLTLSPSWTRADLEEWELPVGWQDVNKTLVVKGPGVALPRQRGFRFYKDFKLTTTVKMSNGVAVSFALRAQDARTYYLVQITGARSDDPHMLRLFLINDGVARRIMGIQVPRSAAAPMDAGQFFTISIKMMDYNMTVEIIDAETGATYPLGVLTDPEHKLPVGAVGIAVRGNEENVIGPFVVCTGEKCFVE